LKIEIAAGVQNPIIVDSYFWTCRFFAKKTVPLRGPLCLPCCSSSSLARSRGCFGGLASPCDALVVGPSWHFPSTSSSWQFPAEWGSGPSPRECELRMARGRDMAVEVDMLVFESARHVFEFTGTITEPELQSQTVWSPARCRSLSCAPVDCPIPERSVQQGTRS
jgi:hypothetical protein